MSLTLSKWYFSIIFMVFTLVIWFQDSSSSKLAKFFIIERDGPYWTVLDRAGPCWTVLDRAGPCWTVLDRTGPYRTELDRAGPFRTVPDLTGPYWTVLDRAWSYIFYLLWLNPNFRYLMVYHSVLAKYFEIFRLVWTFTGIGVVCRNIWPLSFELCNNKKSNLYLLFRQLYNNLTSYLPSKATFPDLKQPYVG